MSSSSSVVHRNARGVIAESYFELQSLGLVERARADREVPAASPESLLRSLLQGVEIALYNMADLLRRASRDAAADDLTACAAKLSWLRGFHRVVGSLASASAAFTAARQVGGATPTLVRVDDSPAFGEFVAALRAFDRRLMTRIRELGLDLPAILANEPLTSPRLLVLHLSRIANHEATAWERQLAATAHPAPTVPLGAWAASHILRRAVYEHELAGDTFFGQFRALHQIPELLTAEMNDRLERTILALRHGDLDDAAEMLVWINALSASMTACLPPMIDNLVTSDYHKIRENLGLTSGSHSIGIRYHLFTDLYEQLCEELEQRLTPPLDGPARVLAAQMVAFRQFVFGWRDAHLHLPRNNLGGGGTRSLTGSPDAVGVVRRMREHSWSHDPARALVGDELSTAHAHTLTDYVTSERSLDSVVLIATGQVTQHKFTDVQERTGFFAGRCPFSKPERRAVRAE